MKLRVKFRKYGPIRFIGHLDVMRFFQKTIRRAEIDIVYTTGFSPHQVMTFAAPLGVGLTSNGEYMDIEVASIISCQDVYKRLNQASVPGIEITSVGILPEKAGNAMASVAAASYTISFRAGRVPAIFDAENPNAISMDTAIQKFMQKESILITKTTKKGSRELDLKQGIYQFTCENSVMHLLLDASSAGNIKPIQVIEALLSDYQETLQENALIIRREDVYTNIGEETTQLVPLDAIATEIYQKPNA